MSRSLLLLAALGGLAVVASGCTPTCQRTCKKLVTCDEVESPRVAIDECEESCVLQEALYEEWDDVELRRDFDDYKSCVVGSSCEEVAAGECYDEDLWIW